VPNFCASFDKKAGTDSPFLPPINALKSNNQGKTAA